MSPLHEKIEEFRAELLALYNSEFADWKSGELGSLYGRGIIDGIESAAQLFDTFFPPEIEQ